MTRYLFFILTLLILSFKINAQTAQVVVIDPNPTPDPLEFCIGDTITVELQDLNPDNYESLGTWYKCSEEPDLVGYSNYDQWEYINCWDLSYSFEIQEEMYIWVQVSDINMGYMTPVLHLMIKGTIPELVYNLSDTTFCEGSTVAISATPDNLGDGNYQWYKDGVELAGQTNFNFTISEAGIYHVTAIDVAGDCPSTYIPSAQVEFSYITPTIYGDLEIDLNRVTFSTDDVYDTYQWYSGSDEMNLSPIAGATSFEYNATITSTDTWYAVEVTLGSCTVMSDAHLVNDIMYNYPVILEPSTYFICRDETVELTVENDVYATYEWYKDGTSIWGETGSSLTVDNSWNKGTGTYTVIVTTVLDETDELESNSIFIEVAERPTIFVENNATLCPDADVTLYTNDNFETYQWLVNDINDPLTAVAISGATDTALVITVLNDDRYYYVSTTNNGCEDVSNSKYVYPYSLNEPYAYTSSWSDEGFLCLGDSIQLRSGGYEVEWQWYLNGELLDGVTAKMPYVQDVGFYTVEASSVLCPNLAPVMSTDTVLIDYTVKPNLSIDPIGQVWNSDSNHLVFCQGEDITLTIDNYTNYNAWQWMGKLFDPSSSFDNWEDIGGANNYFYNFINGENDKLHFKVRVDSLMSDGSVCTGFSDYTTIDAWVFQDPTIASYNTELCEQGDSTLLHLGAPGDWEYFEWYLDGVLIPDSDTDTLYANQEGMHTLTAYPAICPDIPHSSGIGPTITFMPEAGISEEIDGIYAFPAGDTYIYQWYYSPNDPGTENYIENMTAVDADTLNNPWVIMYEQMADGYYALTATNPFECERISDLYIHNILGTDLISNRGMKIYPNPAKEILFIRNLDNKNILTLELVNIHGSTIKEFAPNNSEFSINLEDISSGIYLLRCNYNTGKSRTFNIIKQ